MSEEARKVLEGLSEAQRRMIIASDPDDITGEEGSGVPIRGAQYRTARTLSGGFLRLGSFSFGSPYGDLYFNNPRGLAVRALLLEEGSR